jgi:hypothetical protein
MIHTATFAASPSCAATSVVPCYLMNKAKTKKGEGRREAENGCKRWGGVEKSGRGVSEFWN